jgi:hypothetical protein
MFRPKQEPILTRQDMNGIIQLLMRLDENVRAIRDIVEGEDGEPEEEE